MKDISAGLLAKHQNSTMFKATCVKVVCKDGTEYGFVNINQGFTYEGVEYKPVNSFLPTSINNEEGTGVSAMDADIVISDNPITIEDINTRKFQGAEVTVFGVDYTDLELGHEVKFYGHIGRTTILDSE